MTDRHTPEKDSAEFAAEAGSLWRITFAPATWAGHFLLCYTLFATGCAKGWPVGTVRHGLIGMSVLALAVIALIGWRAYAKWSPRSTGRIVNPRGDAEDRHHFLGHAGFLLAVISFIGVVFVTLPLLLLEGCR